MLKAWLHRKLGRVAGVDAEADTDDSTALRVFSREDPLTSAIFERLTYLEPVEAWSLLHAACEGKDRARIPNVPPLGAPEWSFWPRLSPGVGGSNTRCVEPDVVVTWGDLVLVIEAKHRGAQYWAQWVEEIRAVRANPLFAGKEIIFVAAGGVEVATFAAQVEQARRALNEDHTSYLLLRWARLREACEQRRGGTRPGAAAIVHDLLAALGAWGYRSQVDFESLPRFRSAAALHISKCPNDLVNWSVR